MRLPLVFLFVGMMRLETSWASDCQPVEGARILARELAVAVPEFAALDPQLAVGFSPVPGSRRVMHASDVLSLARRYSIEVSAPKNVCFEWPMRSLERAAVLEAMKASLGLPGAEIAIVEMSRYPVPAGPLEFPTSSLGAPAIRDARQPVLWRGNVIYGGARRFAIWARVTVSTRIQRVTASENLRAGMPIEARHLRLETIEGFPLAPEFAHSIEQVVGQRPLRPISVTSAIRLDQITAPMDVNRGDVVNVEVHAGAAQISIDGKAETAGRSGDVISVRNESSNRLFHARVTGKGKALVITRTPLVK